MFELIPWLIPLLAVIVFLLIQFSAYKAYQDSLLAQLETPPSKVLMALSELLYNHIRTVSYLIGCCWILIGLVSGLVLHSGSAQLTFWVRFLGLSALIWFFWVLTPGLLSVYFPRFELNSLLIYGRRAVGKVTFLMALSHALLAFVHNYKGDWHTFFSLSEAYKLAVLLGLFALIILSLMAITSSDRMMHLLSYKRWKRLHRLGYVAFLFVCLHAFIRGTSFKYDWFSLGVLQLVVIFILLELGATGQMLWRHRKYRALWRSWLYIAILSIFGLYTLIVGFFAASHIIS